MNTNDFLNPLKSVLKKDCIEKLRIIDPRVYHYALYVKLSHSDVKKILDIYPDSRVEYSLFKKIKKISTNGSRSFTIYNVTGKKREKMIKKHDNGYEETLKRIKERHIVF